MVVINIQDGAKTPLSPNGLFRSAATDRAASSLLLKQSLIHLNGDAIFGLQVTVTAHAQTFRLIRVL